MFVIGVNSQFVHESKKDDNKNFSNLKVKEVCDKYVTKEY